jgi:hypothetical protein
LLAALPAAHPSRPPLEALIELLVDRLIRRERCRFEPLTPARGLFGAYLLAAVLVGWVIRLLGLACLCGVHRVAEGVATQRTAPGTGVAIRLAHSLRVSVMLRAAEQRKWTDR